MPYIVEIQVTDGDLTTLMSRMRTWLDHQGFEPISFRISGGGVLPQVCHVNLKTEQEAIAFVQEFGGRVLGAPGSDTASPG